MKYLVVFAIVGGWIRGSHADVTCENVNICTPDISEFYKEEESAQDVQRACKTIRDTMQCFRTAMVDCRRQGNIPEEMIQKIEEQVDVYEVMLDGHCNDTGTRASAISSYLSGGVTSTVSLSTMAAVVTSLIVAFM